MSMRVLMVVSCLAVSAGTVWAQGAAPQVPVGDAKLQMVVGDGLFDLRQGKSIDLTKNQWLLTFPQDARREELETGRLLIKIAGTTFNVRPGDRLDFKVLNPMAKDAKEKDKCFLDLIEIVTPKGAPAAATFRFHCL